MKQDFYILANRIDSSKEPPASPDEIPDSFTQQKYRQDILAAIHSQNRPSKRKFLTAAAACIVVMGAITGIFHNEVQAAIEQIHYSLSEAFGLGSRLSRYTEIVNTAVHNGGYVITLQEAIAAPEKLYVSYLIQREDGQPMPEENFFWITTELRINGEPVFSSGSVSSGFLDSEKKICHCVSEYELSSRNLSGENTYELKITDQENKQKGEWSFEFKADGSEIYADTKSMALGYEYTLPDGTTVILDELRINELEQQILFHTADHSCIQYDSFELYTEDEQGRTARFTARNQENGKGYLTNSYVPDENGPVRTWIADQAKQLTVTAYIIDMPETDGLRTDDYKYQTGDTVTWDLTQLKELDLQ